MEFDIILFLIGILVSTLICLIICAIYLCVKASSIHDVCNECRKRFRYLIPTYRNFSTLSNVRDLNEDAEMIVTV